MTTFEKDKKEKNVTIKSGISFAEALTVLFVGLKLANIISWSWWLVFSPLIIQFGIIAVLIIILLIIMLLASAFSK